MTEGISTRSRRYPPPLETVGGRIISPQSDLLFGKQLRIAHDMRNEMTTSE